MIKLLNAIAFRHPDINANAYTAFGVLAFVILIGMLGVTQSSVPFWIFFTGNLFYFPMSPLVRLLVGRFFGSVG